MKKGFLFILGIILIVFGVMMISGFIMDVATSGDSKKGIFGSFILVLFVGVLPVVGGFLMCRRLIKAPKMKRNNSEHLENEILQLANKRNGSLTAVELAMDTTLNVEEAKEVLDEWARRGIATIKISDGGTLIYQINGMISEEERKSARGINEFD